MQPANLKLGDPEQEEELIQDTVLAKLFLEACAPGMQASEKLCRAGMDFLERHRENTMTYQKSVSTVH